MVVKILIMGDSWAADWSSKHSEYPGWLNILASSHDVTNIAQAGVSQYSICKQMYDIHVTDYDKIIISITSPYRVYTPIHPVHHTDQLHGSADLIYTDIEHHSKYEQYNPRLASAKDYFEHHFDITQAEFTHHLYVDWCLNRLDCDNTVVTSNIEHNSEYVGAHTYCDGFGIWNTYPGRINHLSAEGNEVFAGNMQTLLK